MRKQGQTYLHSELEDPLVSGAPTILPESASVLLTVLSTGLDGLWSRVSGTAQWS